LGATLFGEMNAAGPTVCFCFVFINSKDEKETPVKGKDAKYK
jgi:hypothetical protein